MMRYSHSNVEKFRQCPRAWFWKYAEKLQTLPDYDDDNALIWGRAAHLALQENYEAAEDFVKSYFPLFHEEHLKRLENLKTQTEKARKLIPSEGQCEVKITCGGDFVGFIDYLVKNDDGTYDLYDFKYTSDGNRYIGSPQLSLYKYFWERMTRKKVSHLYYVIIPKNADEPTLKEDVYRFHHVVNFLLTVKRISESRDFPKNATALCRWCEFEDYCEKGTDYMITNLPENKRRTIEGVDRKKLWIYGAPFSGKTTFANKFPDPLMLNTDGNTSFVDAQTISIKDEWEKDGTSFKKIFAWEVFKSVLELLEKKDNSFKTIVVDLLEDLFLSCRLYMYKKLGIEHESDDSYRAWDKVRTEFLTVMKRLMNLDYENIVLISHEDSSKDLTRKTGDKITTIKPNIQEKIANKIAGMVDMVARVVAEDDKRVLSLKPSEVVFGGGRIPISKKEIPLTFEDFTELYKEGGKAHAAEEKVNEDDKKSSTAEEKTEAKEEAQEPSKAADEPQTTEAEEKPVERPRRVRRIRRVVEE